MLISFSNKKLILSLFALGGMLRGPAPQETRHPMLAHPRPATQLLMIRVSQESSPGAGDFDSHILGFVRALQSTGYAADFYEYQAARYGNSTPVLSANTSHIFFVNAADGLALFVVQNNANHPENGNGGAAKTLWELSGGTAEILLSDENGEAVEHNGGTEFTTDMDWAQANTDGMVVGALPVGFTILGQFTAPPKNLGGGWEVISDDGSKISLSLVPGQRVRLDVKLAVRVRQDH